MDTRQAITIAAVGGLLALAMRSGTKPMTAEEVHTLADAVIAGEGWQVDPCMIVAMAAIESNFRPDAYRFEPHLGEGSKGLLQVLPSTARWLFNDMGYRRYSPDDLQRPVVSIYFGAAFVRWLSFYGNQRRSEQWIVESYNGGPGNSNSQTQNHWRKYQAAKEQLCP
ncbi:MAG TPA: hypothetical protein DFI00_08235 [Rhodospirillaceae bacterium]|nr:hypothetical protein [Alphaproteobacteria bacterium]OUT42368.1 MAG: hypothetical protein CBB62_08820 [Micavibrio sp. TMED2]HCI47268.1 hypothetical protein [Rhodospirillaceae bacterium]MAS45997.1 hypothetical protein [Alphaproteobacteria bacterium]MAX95821.1 hypothetical protein [Alphaproteobacteria bacterium]|tara:strand:- start:4083 stop:4583 length:501 start_codon:yes stop_codon:yes gene_type:complete